MYISIFKYSNPHPIRPLRLRIDLPFIRAHPKVAQLIILKHLELRTSTNLYEAIQIQKYIIKSMLISLILNFHTNVLLL